MIDNLKSTISKLYHPPLVGRQVFALSRADAQKLPLIPSTAMISITSKERGEATLADFEYLLRLSFADVDFKNKDLSKRAKEKLSEAFQPAQAIQIIEFVDSLPSTIHTVVVHCEGGYSRSCAVAMFIHEKYNYSVELNKLAKFNPSVKQLLMETSKRNKK